MKILLCCVFFYSSIFAVQKNVYAPCGKNMKVDLKRDQHGFLDKSGLVWLEKGYWFDGQHMVIRECNSSILDQKNLDCASLKMPLI